MLFACGAFSFWEKGCRLWLVPVALFTLKKLPLLACSCGAFYLKKLPQRPVPAALLRQKSCRSWLVPAALFT